MIGLIQRVRSASVSIDGKTVAAIDQGLLVFVGIERDDDMQGAERLAERLLGYRIFADGAGKMNLSLRDLGADAGLLLVPQFTLAADTNRGSRPGFSTAAAPALAQQLFDGLVWAARAEWQTTKAGVFGVDMQVSLINDGPVTFWLEA